MMYNRVVLTCLTAYIAMALVPLPQAPLTCCEAFVIRLKIKPTDNADKGDDLESQLGVQQDSSLHKEDVTFELEADLLDVRFLQKELEAIRRDGTSSQPTEMSNTRETEDAERNEETKTELPTGVLPGLDSGAMMTVEKVTKVGGEEINMMKKGDSKDQTLVALLANVHKDSIKAPLDDGVENEDMKAVELMSNSGESESTTVSSLTTADEATEIVGTNMAIRDSSNSDREGTSMAGAASAAATSALKRATRWRRLYSFPILHLLPGGRYSIRPGLRPNQPRYGPILHTGPAFSSSSKVRFGKRLAN